MSRTARESVPFETSVSPNARKNKFALLPIIISCRFGVTKMSVADVVPCVSARWPSLIFDVVGERGFIEAVRVSEAEGTEAAKGGRQSEKQSKRYGQSSFRRGRRRRPPSIEYSPVSRFHYLPSTQPISIIPDRRLAGFDLWRSTVRVSVSGQKNPQSAGDDHREGSEMVTRRVKCEPRQGASTVDGVDADDSKAI
ncbi:hypothetical protein ZHAS_00019187 [Anopheles sinensis]|uniref:Uncharacterized protein n=1 Tax=Anopheles sinensis TaxID=74873 RepID=A0A084WLN2_ANOSI|nr:hypothetical protein ZHAS_00019187 [Anopheles sinensis]